MNSESIRIAIIGGILGLIGAVSGAWITGYSQVELAKQKLNSDLVLKALEPASSEERLKTLKMLTETKLLKDPEIENAVSNYWNRNIGTPDAIPQVAPTAAFSAPLVANPRIYLLAGTQKGESLFAKFKADLINAGYSVLGAKVLDDNTRPESAEIRYFNPEDEAQAEKIAEVVKFKLSIAELPVTRSHDSSARSGYIEIWFGK